MLTFGFFFVSGVGFLMDSCSDLFFCF
jgi:hypothetical protein